MSFVYAWFLWLLLPMVVYLYQRKEKQRFTQNLRWAVLALLIVTMARPVLPESVSQEKVNTHSLVMALDLSVSMNASDIEPSRALASRASIQSFLEGESQEQIALLGFTINALLLSPPTTDHELVSLALENMNPEHILTKGTDLRKLFEKVAKFKDDEKKVILFTDGGDEALDEELLNFVQEEKIQILAIGMATAQGASVLQKDGTLLQNEEGNIVVSKLNFSLRTLAEQSGGKFVPFVSVASTVESMEDWLSSHENDMKGLERESKQYFELGFVPLLFALVLFFFSATRFSKKLFAFLLLMGLNVQAEELLTRESWGEGVEKVQIEQGSWAVMDGFYLQKAYHAYDAKEYKQSQKYVYQMKNRSLEAQLLLAHVFYKEEKYKAAKSVLKSIKSSERKIKKQIYYELGNCEAKLLYWKKAKRYYVKALQLGEDADALHNLEVVLFRLNDNAFEVGYTNPSSAEKAKNSSDNVETKEVKENGQKNESTGGSGGMGNKKSKNASVKVMKSDDESDSKRVLSSKAYDLINKGYIKEDKPW